MMTWLKQLDRVIRGEATQAAALRSGEIEQPVSGLVIIGIGLGAIYGLCMGSYALFQHASMPLLQLAATTIKVPLLFFLTLAITFPSLYVFNALVGSRLSLLSVVRLLVISRVIMLTVLASLGPIVAFFSASTTSYPFMLLLNVAFYSAAGFLGLRCVLVTLDRLSAAIEEAHSSAVDAVESRAGSPVPASGHAGSPGAASTAIPSLPEPDSCVPASPEQSATPPDLSQNQAPMAAAQPVSGAAGESAVPPPEHSAARLAQSRPRPAPAFAPSPGVLPQMQYDAGLQAQGARPYSAPPVKRPQSRDVLTVFRIWIMVFGLVGAQMAWVLRPFLGSPHHVFSWFRPRSSNFFEAVLYALQHLFK